MKKTFSALLCSLWLIQGNGTPVLAFEEETFETMGDAAEEMDNKLLEEIERVSIDEEPMSAESSNIVHSGTLGTAQWTIDSNGTLTIGEGTFKIPYGYGHYKNKDFSWPWAQFINEITHVDGSAPFTAIGDYNSAFTSISSLKTPSITSIDLSGWDTSQVTKMNGIFINCSSLTSINLSGWDFSSTKDVQYMFAGCSSLTSLELLGWKFPSFEAGSRDFLDLGGLFKNCTSLTSLNLSGWDISSPRKDMMFMFEGCSSLTTLNLSGWDTT
ncbi:MAG: DUF285 domain-containing protein, partial [Allobaculum sp.]|nr:DUF285 domain-containing protein [Allobaculum sp.]